MGWVFVLNFSTNASWEPLTTISFLGVSIPLAAKPLTSMENAMKLKVPLKVELSEADNWYKAK